MCKVQRIVCGNVNSYLVSNKDQAILVDTGREQDVQKVLDACKPFHMRLLLLTHGHVDHVQNAAFLAKALKIPIAMNEADVSLLKDNMQQPLSAKGLLGKIVLSASIKSFHKDKIPSFTPDILIKEGDSLEDYGILAKAISLSGHTEGSIGLDIMDKYVIVGDALMNMFYPTVSMLYHDKAAMLKSAQRISSLGDRQIFFGHGKPMNNRDWVKK